MQLLALHLLYRSQGYALAIEALRVIAINTGAVHALDRHRCVAGCDKLAARRGASRSGAKIMSGQRIDKGLKITLDASHAQTALQRLNSAGLGT